MTSPLDSDLPGLKHSALGPDMIAAVSFYTAYSAKMSQHVSFGDPLPS